MGVKSQEGPASAWGSSGGGAAGGQGVQARRQCCPAAGFRGASAYVWVSVYSCVRAGRSVFACVSEGLVMMYMFLVVCHHELFVSIMRVCVFVLVRVSVSVAGSKGGGFSGC